MQKAESFTKGTSRPSVYCSLMSKPAYAFQKLFCPHERIGRVGERVVLEPEVPFIPHRGELPQYVRKVELAFPRLVLPGDSRHMEVTENTLFVSSSRDLRPQIAKTIVDNNGLLVRMNIESYALEDIYMKYFTGG